MARSRRHRCAQPAISACSGPPHPNLVGFLPPARDLTAEPIDPRTWPTEADFTRRVTAEELCDMSPNRRIEHGHL